MNRVTIIRNNQAFRFVPGWYFLWNLRARR